MKASSSQIQEAERGVLRDGGRTADASGEYRTHCRGVTR
jgi:hypothetical protein